MSLTIDCGEGRHAPVCRGKGRHHYLIPQLNDGEEFECDCPCHKLGYPEEGEYVHRRDEPRGAENG